ncbi:MAG TPA: mercuric transporter MerT family protein [Trueperaceae bacterium]|jgi:mercuric ion transport protein
MAERNRTGEIPIADEREEIDRASRRGLWASLGAVGAAFLGALCCVGPLLFVAFGVGAGLASTFEPLRPVFGILMVLGLGTGFYTVYGRRRLAEAQCEPGEVCSVPRSRRRDRVILWTATALALVFWTFPTWSTWLV